MRSFRSLMICGVAAALALPLGSPSFGALYLDSTGENFDGNAHMDISSVEVTDDGTNISFKISVSAASINSPADWGKYVVGIDTGSGTGDFNTPVGNPWGRNISMADGMDAWIGSWVDGATGFQAWAYAGGSWSENASGTPALNGNSTSITTSLASLGLSPGQPFKFDVYTTGGGGGDSANDSLANPNQTVNDWQVPYATPSGGALSYPAIPEPASLALVAFGMVAMLGASRRMR